MTFAVSVSLLALVVALTAAIPGVVLVLRRQAMLSDALSHAVLPGIAVGALWTTNPNSPILLIGATLSGVLVMALTEWVRGRKRVTEDSATGLIFPAFFAIGVILISTKFNRSSISEHTVLVGDLNISAMQHLVVGTIDFGPKSAWIIGAVGLLTLVLLLVAKRPLAISTFDPVFARTVGIRTRLINYLVMTMVSLTIVVVFDAAGAVLAVALMIVPAATALMIASSEGAMLLVTLVVAAVSFQAGFWVAYRLDAATSPTMAFVDGLIFLAVWGIIRARRRLRR
ncbi:metal ABC transporter permease [Corynebacterium diphtheriae]|nr:metal ABC transporter permease [Corynebacterium diphtheriae]